MCLESGVTQRRWGGNRAEDKFLGAQVLGAAPASPQALPSTSRGTIYFLEGEKTGGRKSGARSSHPLALDSAPY